MTRPDPLARVRAVLAQQVEAGLSRQLRPRSMTERILDLASNDYLGLSRHPDVVSAAASAALDWGAGSTGSRLVTGSTELHAQLETELAEVARAPAALAFSSGFLANLGVLGALGGPDVTIVSDRTNHASLIDGCRLSGAQVVVARHAAPAEVDAALAAAVTAHRIVVSDAVFSVDGDLAPLRELHAVTRRHGALLIVDEAHSFGVVGPGGGGAVVGAGLSAEPDVIRTVTLSKALGAQGGAVLGPREVIDLLVNTARPFIFDTGLAPAAAAGALAALRVLRAEPHRATRARSLACELARIVSALGLGTAQPAAAVVPVYLGDSTTAVAAAADCLRRGVRVGCFRPPSVPPGQSCLRLTARADLTDDGLDTVRAVLSAVLNTVLV